MVEGKISGAYLLLCLIYVQGSNILARRKQHGFNLPLDLKICRLSSGLCIIITVYYITDNLCSDVHCTLLKVTRVKYAQNEGQVVLM